MNNYVRVKTRSTARIIFGYFLKGLLVTLPIAGTIALIVIIINWIDHLLPIGVPGLGFVVVVAGITLIGFASGILIKPLLDIFDDVLEKIPGIKVVYSFIKDFMEAFVGDKKKFSEPVMVEMNSNGIMKLGFITSKDLRILGIEGYVAVYFPHSYNFSGNLFLVPLDKVKPISGQAPELMKFIVSGGVTDLDGE